jgi:hypothetical protein
MARVALLASVWAVAACGSSDPETVAATSQAIVGGTVPPSAASPVVRVVGPQGLCSGVLVADNLVATARHCTAQFTKGAITCTPSGELAAGSPGGALGADYPPAELQIHLASSAATGSADAVGTQILSTQSPSGCRDDLSFIVLDRSLPVVPVPVRLSRPTSIGDSVSVWGYGQTMNASDPTELRVYAGAQIVGIGPTVATTVPELAPVRSVRVGTGAITCDGDSGGPILSTDTGALIALISIGSQAVAGGGCAATGDSPTTGPHLSEYQDLVLQAFAAASASPNLEPAAQDAGSDVGAPDGGGDVDASEEPDASPGPALSGGCCVALPQSPGSAKGLAPVVGLAIAPVVRRLRRSARGPKARRSAAALRTIGGIIRRAVTGGRGGRSAPRHSCGARRDGL